MYAGGFWHQIIQERNVRRVGVAVKFAGDGNLSATHCAVVPFLAAFITSASLAGQFSRECGSIPHRMQYFGALLVGPEYCNLLLFLACPVNLCCLGGLVSCSTAILLIGVAAAPSTSVRVWFC